MTTRLGEIEVILVKYGSEDVPEEWIMQLVDVARAGQAVIEYEEQGAKEKPEYLYWEEKYQALAAALAPLLAKRRSHDRHSRRAGRE